MSSPDEVSSVTSRSVASHKALRTRGHENPSSALADRVEQILSRKPGRYSRRYRQVSRTASIFAKHGQRDSSDVFAGDAELLHAGVQCGAVHAQLLGGAAGAGNLSAALCAARGGCVRARRPRGTRSRPRRARLDFEWRQLEACPGERIMARSIMCSSSRILPGQG